MSPPPSARGAGRRDPEPSEPLGSGPRVKTCSSSCLSWLHPLRSWSLRQTRGGSDPIAVSDHVTGSPVPRKGLDYLTCTPLCCRVGCDADPRAAPTTDPPNNK